MGVQEGPKAEVQVAAERNQRRKSTTVLLSVTTGPFLAAQSRRRLNAVQCEANCYLAARQTQMKVLNDNI
jgi:hypothetical protein